MLSMWFYFWLASYESKYINGIELTIDDSILAGSNASQKNKLQKFAIKIKDIYLCKIMTRL